MILLRRLKIYIQYRNDIKTWYKYRKKGCFKSWIDERDKYIEVKKVLKLFFKEKLWCSALTFQQYMTTISVGRINKSENIKR